VSEQADQTSGQPGSTGAEPTTSNSSLAKAIDAAAEAAPASTEAPSLVPGDAAEPSAPKAEAPKAEAVKAEPVKAEAVKDTVKQAAKSETPRQPGKLLIMSPAARDWQHEETGPETHSETSEAMFGKRRLAALAAVVALAMLAGAVGGAMATVSLQHLASNNTAVALADTAGPANGLGTSVARLDADVLALKAGVEHTSKMGMSQFNKTSDRLDKLEKAQADSTLRLAKLNEGVEKLHVTPTIPVAAAAPQTAPKEITGSITPPAAPAQTAAAAPTKPEVKAEIGRLPTLDNWVLQDVNRGGALIEGRRGLFEVYAGDVVPGLGRIDAVRRQDGRWVVVTSKGLIVAR
jgi:hypothetical protein